MRLPTVKAAPPDDRFDRETSEFDRSLGFFDAVYAFALTLLILNIDLPKERDWASVGTLVHAIGWQAIGFIISFVVIVDFWLTNSKIISRLRALDTTAVIMNVVVVGLVILIPFTTQAISDPGLENLPLPTVVYACNVAAAILMQTAMYELALARGLGRYVRSASTRRWEIIDSLSNPVVFLVSIPVTLLFGGIPGKITWWAMLILGPITGRLTQRARRADLTDAVHAGNLDV
jgi:uncharacterized membrane protein